MEPLEEHLEVEVEVEVQESPRVELSNATVVMVHLVAQVLLSSKHTGNMTLEQALICGIGALSTALTWAVTKLWAKSEECEADRRALRHAIEDLRAEHGLAKGMLESYKNCPLAECPFSPKL